MKSIYIEENFLTDAECDVCISYYAAMQEQTFFYQDNKTRPLDLIKDIQTFKPITDKVLNLCTRLLPGNYELSNHEIVHWSRGSKMNLHYDFDFDKWSAILYLNDDYYGGRTIFENGLEVKSKKGTIVLFNGSTMQHGVTEVLNGDRFTMAYWIKG